MSLLNCNDCYYQKECPCGYSFHNAACLTIQKLKRLTIRNSDGSVSQPTDLKWAEALEKLAAYEDAEVNGHLIMLPVKIGDPVYYTEPIWRKFVSKGIVSMLQQKADGTWKFRISDGSSVWDRPMSAIGQTIFLSLEEAERRLQGESHHV